ncbi:protein YIPF1 [Strongylocentrotus purpuratus]|uniref:Protein YIPF n=1 Tax=Strongylocentrotus purpuratus TaxID=7668 RepID=A0A7M7PM29_STRPU|nr:protein YIPF1 [Strongylocentrotus purpuratus]
MAETTGLIIDVDEDDDQTDLNFQDFGDASLLQDLNDTPTKPAQVHTFHDDDMDDEGDTELLSGQKKQPSLWTFEYYQQFFDVDTSQVGRRLLGSFIPHPTKSFLDSHIRPSPDLYGPLWVCITLVFTIAISGDMADYIANMHSSSYVWHAHFSNVTIAAVVIFAYAWIIPSCLYGFLHHRGNLGGYTFLELVCLYGYSLTIYIPISMLWMIDVNWLRWVLVLIGLVLSSAVLLLALWPSVKNDEKKFAAVALFLVFAFHAGLAIGFKMYFFHVGHIVDPTIAPVTTKPSIHSLTAEHIKTASLTAGHVRPATSGHTTFH